MKLYHYLPKKNDALQRGILSFSKNLKANIDYYRKRSGFETHPEIVLWMESCFEGRSRGIRCLVEPLKYTRRTKSIKAFIENSELFEIDVLSLEKDGLLEAVYVSPSVLEKEPENKNDELLCKLSDLSEIDFSPNNYDVLSDKKGWRFAFVRYYLLVIKDGIIPAGYIKLVK